MHRNAGLICIIFCIYTILACIQLLCEKIVQLESKYGEVLVPVELLRDLQQTELSMDEKEIMVNVFGEQNCGKSTFLNALLGD